MTEEQYSITVVETDNMCLDNLSLQQAIAFLKKREDRAYWYSVTEWSRTDDDDACGWEPNMDWLGDEFLHVMTEE